jgi:hypothetical protein
MPLNKATGERMYKNAKTWNPFVGCGFACLYCSPTFQAILKRFSKCQQCRDYAPHWHPERLDRIPNKPIIFVCGTGDISFATHDQRIDIYYAMFKHAEKHPDTVFYLQSKNPAIFVGEEKFWPENTWVGTTMETNRDTSDYSCAPLPKDRAEAMCRIDWPNKYLTVEPIMKFDMCEFRDLIAGVHPDFVYIGYNSKPTQAHLPEPAYPDVIQLCNALRCNNIEIRTKLIREAF